MKKCRYCDQHIEKNSSSETGWSHLVTGEVKCTSIVPKAMPKEDTGE